MFKKMSPTVHNRPEFKEARKAFEGINSTPKIAREKSIKRHAHHEVLNRLKEGGYSQHKAKRLVESRKRSEQTSEHMFKELHK